MIKINSITEEAHKLDILRVLTGEIEIEMESGELLPEIISNILIGSRQTRQGGRPPLSFLSKMYAMIEDSIQKNEPIQIGIPMGPKKPGDVSDVDLAELWMLRTLDCFNKKVKINYKPGLRFILYFEDVTAIIFEKRDFSNIQDIVKSYLVNLNNLIHVLGLQRFIQIEPESKLTTPEDFEKEIMKIQGPMNLYLSALTTDDPNSDTFLKQIQDQGWSGSISSVTLAHYTKQFGRNYPKADVYEITYRLALYFAASYARYKLNIRSLNKNGIIAASFAKPTPGIELKYQERLFLRNIPMHKTKLHTPFWRAKGFLEDDGSGELQTKLAPYWVDELEFERVKVVLENEEGMLAALTTDIKIHPNETEV